VSAGAAASGPAPVAADEVPDLATTVQAAFHHAATPEEAERRARRIEPERTLALRDGGRIVAATAIYSRRVTVPGAEVPVAAVTHVGVLPSHRRRGLLTVLMRRQLADVHDAGAEAVAALWASEAAIYGRFGYGLAAEGSELRVLRAHARLRAEPVDRAEVHVPAEAIEAMRPIHDAVRRDRPGMLDRAGSWWEARVEDPEASRGGADALRAAVVEGEGYALYAVKAHW